MSSTNGKGSGNPARGDTGFRERLEKLGRRVEGLEKQINRAADRGLAISTIKFMFREETHGDVLAVMEGYDESGYVVAFNSDYDFSSCFMSLCGRLQGGHIRWKPDEYKNKRASEPEGS